MKKSSNMAVVAYSIGWSGIGSRDAISDVVAPDGDGNRIDGEVGLHDGSQGYIQSNQRLEDHYGRI
jgi:mannose-1-phosphate guanylyltransferase/mannose-6-phosphate isomerase